MPTHCSLTFWSNWLLLAAGFMVLDGMSAFILSKFYANVGYDFLFGADAYKTLSEDALIWLRSLITLAGAMEGAAGVVLAGMARYPFRRGERWAWISVAMAAIPWSVVAVLKMAILLDGEKIGWLLLGGAQYWLLYVPPVAFSWRHFFRP